MTVEVTELTDVALGKEARLKQILESYGKLAIAYSGGVDSAYLSDVAHEVLGAEATLILADSPSIPRAEVTEATQLAAARGWNLQVIFTNEFENEAYLKNDGKRCYFCKSELFEKMSKYAEDHELRVLAYGAIMDDTLDPTRLGAKAASERAVVAPLQEAELSKAEIRVLSQRRELPTWNKASFACLSSRLPVGTRVSVESISKIEKAEEVLKALGFRQYRARHHGDLCRIEIDPADFVLLADAPRRQELVKQITAAGYRYVTLDLVGYRTGSTAAATKI